MKNKKKVRTNIPVVDTKAEAEAKEKAFVKDLNTTLDTLNNLGGDMHNLYWQFRGIMKTRGYETYYDHALGQTAFHKV